MRGRAVQGHSAGSISVNDASAKGAARGQKTPRFAPVLSFPRFFPVRFLFGPAFIFQAAAAAG
jgi:hypothetical protein